MVAIRSRTSSRKTRRNAHKLFLDALEPRTLLSSTLFVYGGPADSTHFNTLQAALAVAASGDTIHLQAGFSTGTFLVTSLSSAASVGDTTIHTTLALDIGDIVSIGTTSGSDPLERNLVTAVTPSGSGDFILTLASPLQFAHTGSPVSATNSSTTGPTIGLDKSLTLIADAGAPVLPFNLEVWKTATGVTVAGLSMSNLFLDGDANTLSGLTVSNQLLLSNAHNNSLTGLTVNNRILVDIGSSGNTVSDSTIKQLKLNPGAHDNNFNHNTFTNTVTDSGGVNSGHESFSSNTFNATVNITGNLTAATSDSFVNNTFNVASGDALKLEHVDGTVVQGNTFNLSASFRNAVSLHNSDNVVIATNTFNLTGSQSTGIYANSDGTGSTSVDITGNTIHTTDGYALYLAKWDTTANFEARVQSNVLTNNAVGVYIFGDGNTAGSVDLGGGSTRFGSSTGNNDFTSFAAADDLNFAIGLFSTSNTDTVHAQNNLFSVSDPTTVVADSAHDAAAFGSGIIDVTVVVPPPVEVITATAANLSVVQTGATHGSVASFTDSLTHSASDFTALISWGDGSTSLGTVVATNSGGFEVRADHTWNVAGSFTFTVAISSNSGGSASATGTASVTPRTLSSLAFGGSVEKGNTFTGTVANFTDNLPGTLASSYVASITWSDGTTSPATINMNADGSFSVSTSRTFNDMGFFVGTVSIATLDGQFVTTASLTVTVTNPNGKLPPGKDKSPNAPASAGRK